MAEYNLSEFRKNTRKAFDEAERGEPVYIERYGEDFILISKKNWNDTMSLHSKGVNTLITDEVSSNIQPDLPTCPKCGFHTAQRTADGGCPYCEQVKNSAPVKKNNSDSQANDLPGVDSL